MEKSKASHLDTLIILKSYFSDIVKDKWLFSLVDSNSFIYFSLNGY